MTRRLLALITALVCAVTLARAQTAAPSALTVEASAATNQVTLSWSAVAGATGYNVKRGASPSSSLTVLATNLPPATLTYSDSTATAGQVYFYTVTAVGPGGESPPTRGVLAAPGVILDNATAGNTAAGVSFTGAWSASNVAGSFGNASLFAGQVAGATPTATYTFTPTLPTPGNYDVYLRWTADPNRATNTPIDFISPDETRTRTVNQELNGGVWNLVTTIAAEAGATTSVTIRNNGANGNVVADAVQFVPRLSPLAPATEKPAEFTLVPLSDDFEGAAINGAVWSQFLSRPEFSVSGGKLHLKLRWKGTTPIASATQAELDDEANWSEGGITTRFAQKFGYHEARLRLPQVPAKGVDTAYWHNAYGEYIHGYEIDAPEFFNSDADGSSNHYGFGVWDHFLPTLQRDPELRPGRTWDYTQNNSTLGEVTKFITIGLEWRTDNSQVIYVNGQKVHTVPSAGMNDTESLLPSAAILSTKALDFLHPNAALDGAEATWDYVRYFQKPGWLGAVDGTWSNAANWGADGLPAGGDAAVFNVPTANTAISLPTDQSLQSLYFDGTNAPSLAIGGPGALRLGVGKDGDTSVTHGGIVLNSEVATPQTIHAPIVGEQNLQFINLSRYAGATLTLNGTLTGNGTSRDVQFITSMPAVGTTTLGQIVLTLPLGPGLRDVTKVGDATFTLPAGSQHTGRTAIARGPMLITDLSALGVSAGEPVVLRPNTKHSEPYRPRLIFQGTASTCARPLMLAGLTADGVLESSGGGALTWTGDVVIAPGSADPGRTISNQASLTLGGTNTANNFFAGEMSDVGVTVTNGTVASNVTLTVNKANAGTWVLTGDNSTKASLVVNGGDLFIGHGTSGTFDTPGIVVGSGAEIGFGRDDAVSWSAPITGSGGLRKRGAGEFTLAGAHSFTGGVLAESGVLNLTGTLASGGTFTVTSTGTLTGTGTTAKNTTISGTLLDSTLTFAGNLTLGSTSKIRATFTGNSAAGIETITAAGVTVNSGAKVDVVLNAAGSTANFIQSFWRTARTFPLLTATTKSGSLAIGTVSTDSAGNSAATYGGFSLQQTSTAVNLVWTPLPGFPVVDEPTLAIVSPAANPVAITDTALSLRLAANVGGGTTTTIVWSLVSGPGTVTSPDANAADTTVQFSAAGKYVLRATASNALGSVSADLTVFVNPATILSFRQGVSAYSHAATFIRGDTATWNSGARDQLLVGRNNGGMRALLGFDLSMVPSDAPIGSATLDLWIAATGNGTTLDTLQLHRLTAGFTEGTGDGSSATNGTGTGADWNTRTGAPGSAWSVAGGAAGADYDATALATISGFNPTTTTAGTQFTFASSAEWIAAINAATASAEPLSLMVIADGDSATGSVFARFASDDHATLARRPLLTIQFAYQLAPTITLGSAPSAVAGTPVNFSASATAATSSMWSQVSGPGTVAFTDASAPTTGATFSHGGTYVLRYSAANAFGETSRTLTVSVLSRLESWRQLHFGTTANTGTAADTFDANADGEVNLLEFATAQHPGAATQAIMGLVKNGAVLELTYTRATAALADGLTFTAEWSDTLAAGSWSSVGVTEQILGDNGTVLTVRASVGAGPNARRFLRLKLTKP
jgi:autotransporter-associated beta strand protein